MYNALQAKEKNLNERLNKAMLELKQDYTRYQPYFELLCVGFEAKHNGLLNRQTMGEQSALTKLFSQHQLVYINYKAKVGRSTKEKDAVYVSAISIKESNINFSICSLFTTETDKFILHKPQIETEQMKPYASLHKFRTNIDIPISIKFQIAIQN